LIPPSLEADRSLPVRKTLSRQIIQSFCKAASTLNLNFKPAAFFGVFHHQKFFINYAKTTIALKRQFLPITQQIKITINYQ
jgi:hypothetical protein